MPRSAHGFTLVELLVVIAIIAILAVIGITVFTSVQRNARDARRRADLDAISKALEINKAATGYIALAITHFANGAIPSTDPQGYSYCANSTASNQPTDPSATWLTGATPGTCPTNYGAVGTTNPPAGTSWKICAWLESGSVFCKYSAQ